jgi:hypothetical protein
VSPAGGSVVVRDWRNSSSVIGVAQRWAARESTASVRHRRESGFGNWQIRKNRLSIGIGDTNTQGESRSALYGSLLLALLNASMLPNRNDFLLRFRSVSRFLHESRKAKCQFPNAFRLSSSR